MTERNRDATNRWKGVDTGNVTGNETRNMPKVDDEIREFLTTRRAKVTPERGVERAPVEAARSRRSRRALAGADIFTGDAWIDVIARGDEPSRVRVRVVRFAPGARNAWHAHAVGQTVHVTEGIGRIQARGGDIIEIRAGDTVHTPPGEWHWHGAAPDNFMTHLAIWEAPAEGPGSEWGDQVTDAEYFATADQPR